MPSYLYSYYLPVAPAAYPAYPAYPYGYPAPAPYYPQTQYPQYPQYPYYPPAPQYAAYGAPNPVPTYPAPAYGGGVMVGQSQSPRRMDMYPYGIGQEVLANAAAIQAAQAARIRATQGLVPVWRGNMVPAITSNLPTNRVLAEVDAVDASSVPALVPMLGINPRIDLLKGFIHASKKICKHGCGHLYLKTDLPFLIERLWVEGHDIGKFKIEQIAVGQRILSTGNGFRAKYLKRSDGRHGYRFDFKMAIDMHHPLKFMVKNESSKSRRFRVAAWGQQLAE